jgi:hypothetical protein
LLLCFARRFAALFWRFDCLNAAYVRLHCWQDGACSIISNMCTAAISLARRFLLHHQQCVYSGHLIGKMLPARLAGDFKFSALALQDGPHWLGGYEDAAIGCDKAADSVSGRGLPGVIPL